MVLRAMVMRGEVSRVIAPARTMMSQAQLSPKLKTTARPTMKTAYGSWLSAIPFAKGPKNANRNDPAASRKVGEAGAGLNRHERRTWLHLQARGTPTSEWTTAMTMGADHFQKFLVAPEFPPTQLEAVCRACSDPKNSHLLLSDDSSPNTLSAAWPEPAPRWVSDGNGGGEWAKTAWFCSKHWVRHEKRTDHEACMRASFPHLSKTDDYEEIRASQLSPTSQSSLLSSTSSSQNQMSPSGSDSVNRYRREDAQPGGRLSVLPTPSARQSLDLSPHSQNQSQPDPSISFDLQATIAAMTAAASTMSTAALYALHPAFNYDSYVDRHELALVNTVFRIALSGHPLSNFRSECMLQRLNLHPDFTAISANPTGGELQLVYEHESRDTAMQLLSYLSDVIQTGQRIRLSGAPVSIQCDASTDKGGLHTITIDVRYYNSELNCTVTEFLQIASCSGSAEDITSSILFALYQAIGPEIVDKFVGGSFDGASSMMGNKTGVQTRLRQHFPFAVFIHCVAHRGALVMKKSTQTTSHVASQPSEASS